MSQIPTLPGIAAETVTTARISTRVLTAGDPSGVPVLFIHGNASNATYWEEVMLALPAGFRAIAYDQRGFAGADRSAKIDATRGTGDLADDAFALLDTLGYEKAHVVGHSMGGSVVWRMMMDASERMLTVTFVAPGSPYGFGGTKGLDGELCFPDAAGSGAGIVSAEFARRIAEGDRGSDSPTSPRNVMLAHYFKPPFKPAREEELLSGILSEYVGPDEYPGDFVASANWPMVAPGVWGVNNALSPLYRGDVSLIWTNINKPPVLWVRGADDQIVSDTSLYEMGTLGQLGFVPGWPGADVYPPQPMVSQVRSVLDRYADHGGVYSELVIADAGHTPYIEKPDEFNAALHRHLGA